MHWLEIAAIVFGLLGFAAMGAVLAYRIYRNPLLLAGLASVIWTHMWPVIVKYVLPVFTKRMDAETEARWRDCERRGGKWDPVRKRCDR